MFKVHEYTKNYITVKGWALTRKFLAPLIRQFIIVEARKRLIGFSFSFKKWKLRKFSAQTKNLWHCSIFRVANSHYCHIYTKQFLLQYNILPIVKFELSGIIYQHSYKMVKYYRIHLV